MKNKVGRKMNHNVQTIEQETTLLILDSCLMTLRPKGAQ
jgi:hypothetical protein